MYTFVCLQWTGKCLCSSLLKNQRPGAFLLSLAQNCLLKTSAWLLTCTMSYPLFHQWAIISAEFRFIEWFVTWYNNVLSSFLHYTGKLYFGVSVVSLKLQFETVFFILDKGYISLVWELEPQTQLGATSAHFGVDCIFPSLPLHLLIFVLPHSLYAVGLSFTFSVSSPSLFLLLLCANSPLHLLVDCFLFSSFLCIFFSAAVTVATFCFFSPMFLICYCRHPNLTLQSLKPHVGQSQWWNC